MLERAKTDPTDRNLVRLLGLDLARAGDRQAGPHGHSAPLREYAGLGGRTGLGAIDKVELWNRESWVQKVLPEEERLTQGDDG